MATVAVRGNRKTQVKEPKPNGRGGQINAPPRLVDKACTLCGDAFSIWEQEGRPDRSVCYECDPAPGLSPPDAAAAAKKTVDGSAEKGLIEISVDVRKIEIVEQARKDFDQAKIDALAESIERDGLLQPPVVRHNPGNAAQPYRLVAGERRVRAVKKLGWSSVPVRLASGAIDDAQALLLQGEENVLREQFNDVELAQWCKLATSPASEGGGGLTQEALAKRLGVTQAEISNRIRFLRCPPSASTWLSAGKCRASMRWSCWRSRASTGFSRRSKRTCGRRSNAMASWERRMNFAIWCTTRRDGRRLPSKGPITVTSWAATCVMRLAPRI